VRRLPFGSHLLEEALAFCARAPVGHFDAALRRRLLTGMTSAPEGTIVLTDDTRAASGGLALVGTVIDVIADASAAAELVVLGARGGWPAEDFATEVVAPALAFARRVGRARLQLARPAFVDGGDASLARAGFAPDYDSFLMRRDSGAPPDSPPPSLPPGWRWRPLDEALVGAAHAALREIFRDAPSTTLPPLDEFRRGALGAVPGWHVLLDGDAIAGLVRLSAEGAAGEVRILGRSPAYRGRGLGRVLLDHGLRVLAARPVEIVTLDVAASNERALALYRDFGFEIVTRTSYLVASV
jgi:ribosomal protein S18 acetylase RimI-like enzyme